MKAARLKGWTDRRISLPSDQVAPTKRLKSKNDPVLNLKCESLSCVPCVYYFFVAVVVIRYETTATARWVRAFFNDTITVAVWTGFHVCASWGCYHTPAITSDGAFSDPALGAAFAKECGTNVQIERRFKACTRLKSYGRTATYA